MRAAAVGLVALYLPGAPGGSLPRRSWWAVRDALSSLTGREGLPEALRNKGLMEHAHLVEEPGRLDWAIDRIARGEALTAACAGYPGRWLEALGGGAPPALWTRGEPPLAEFVGFAGSRTPSSDSARFTAAAARAAVEQGYAICSGDARGVDRIAGRAASAGRLLVVLPCGIRRARPLPGVCQLSACPPDSAFSTAQAMERNALIYSSGEFALAVQPRYLRGGTWHGASGALRRRLTCVCVYGPGSRAVDALESLGAHSVRDAGFVLSPPEPPQPDPELFGDRTVREPTAHYRCRRQVA